MQKLVEYLNLTSILYSIPIQTILQSENNGFVFRMFHFYNHYTLFIIVNPYFFLFIAHFNGISKSNFEKFYILNCLYTSLLLPSLEASSRPALLAVIHCPCLPCYRYRYRLFHSLFKIVNRTHILYTYIKSIRNVDCHINRIATNDAPSIWFSLSLSSFHTHSLRPCHTVRIATRLLTSPHHCWLSE